MPESNLRVNDPTYQSIRERVLERDGRTCVDCGHSQQQDSAKQIHVHHIIPERMFTDQNAHRLQNLVTLCSMCHGAWEKEFRAMMSGVHPWDGEVKDRILKRLGDDVEFLEEHFPEVHDLVVEAACEGADDAE